MRVPNGVPQSFGNPLDSTHYSLGVMAVSVINPLICPVGTASALGFNVYKCGGPDYILYGVGNNNPSIVNALNYFQPSSRSEALDDIETVVAQSDTSITTIDLAPPGRPYDSSNFDSPWTSLTEMMKCFTKCGIVTVGDAIIPLTAAGVIQIDIGLLLFAPTPIINYSSSLLQPGYVTWPIITPAYNSNCGFISYFGSMFRGYRGSTRLKMRLTTNNAGSSTEVANKMLFWLTPDASAQVPVNIDGGASGQLLYSYIAPTTVVAAAMGVDNVFVGPTVGYKDYATSQYIVTTPPREAVTDKEGYTELEIPHVSQYNFLQRTSVFQYEKSFANTDFCTPGTLVVSTNNGSFGPTPAAGRLEIWAAIGDEFRFGLFLGPPPVMIRGTTNNDTLPITIFPDTYLPHVA